MSNETDLDWLARNVHKWPEGKCEVLVSWPRNVGTLIWSYVSSDAGWITKEQWLARRAELQNKPSWDKAEDWAEWLAQDEDGEWKWLAGLPGKYVDGWTAVKIKGCCKGLALGDWRDTLEKRPQAEADITAPFNPEFRSVTVSNETIPLEQPVMVASIGDAIQGKCPSCGNTGIHACLGRKVTHTDTANEITKWVAKQQAKETSDWHERGELPPVGTECEAKKYGKEEWYKVVICGAGKHLGLAVAFYEKQKGSGAFTCSSAEYFRPIRTEREVLIEHMQSDIAERWANCEELATHLVDKGWVKMGK